MACKDRPPVGASAQAARGLRRRRGRRLTLKVPLPQAKVEEAQALELFDTWRWLLTEIRQALEPITPTHRPAAAAQSQATLETALELLRQLGQADLIAFAADLCQTTISHNASQRNLTLMGLEK